MNERLRTDAAFLLSRNQNKQTASMRKYQQVALALITIVSLIAFLFYKHEYDRLHFTFEYLETFGTVEDENNLNLCGNKAYRKLHTAPAYWQTLSPDLAVYSTFWDVKSSTLLALVLYRGGKRNVYVDITSEYNSTVATMRCKFKPEESNKKIGIMTCSSSSQVRKPFLARYKVDKETFPPFIYVQRSEDWKSVSNATCVCIFSMNDFVPNQKIVEFMAYHNSIGVEKFVFYGQLLTATTRKILDMTGDEMGIFYEEKQFNVPAGFTLTVNEYRKLVEMDCTMRHKIFYENVVALQPNEYIMITKGKPSLNAVIGSAPFSQTKMSSFISKLHLMTRYVCYEMVDSNKPYFSMDLKVLKNFHDDKVSIIRPHLISDGHFNQTLDNEHNIPTRDLAIYNFHSCSFLELTDYDSLHINETYLSLIERSLVYRKFKVYD